DTDKATDQTFEVVVRAKVVTVTPEDPKDPGTEVDPGNPDGPEWPDGVKATDLNETVKRTIKYQYEDGSEAQPDVVETLTYKRTATVNLVTKDVTYGEWTSADDDFDKVDTPAIAGYTPDKASVEAELDVPATAADKEVIVTYVKDAQKATITYKDDNGQTLGAVDEVTGKSGEPINYTTTARITELTNQGYEVVSDGFTKDGGQVFDTDKDTPQTFTVIVKAKVVSITPDNPQTPGTPVDPNNPDGPKWEDVSRTITRKVSYVVESPEGETVTAPEGKTTTVTFERTGSYNFVTKQVTYTDWEAKDGDAVLEGNPLPVIDGYVAIAATKNGDKVEASTTAEDVTATETTTDISEVVTYKKLSSWTVTPPPGNDPVPDIPYENDPNDPTKPADPKPTRPNEEDPNNPIPTVPDYPGYVPVDPDGNELPKDDNGNYIPPTPKDPSQPTPITYKPVEQVGKISFVDVTVPENPVTKVTIDLSGKTGDKLGMDVSSIVTMYENLGYTVTNKDNYDKDGTFGPDLKSNTFVYELVERTVNIDPDDPNTVSLTVKYVDDTGADLRPTESKEVKVGDDYTTTPQVIEGYYLTEIPANSKGKVGAEGTTVVYVYNKLGSWVPELPEGHDPVPPIPYPNHPTDPGKPGIPTGVVPVVPGYIPVGPDGKELPKGPDGNYLPPVPSKPGEDTVIKYIPQDASVTVRYVDDKGNDLIPSKSIPGKVGDDYTTTPEIIKGYLLKEVPSNASGKIPAGGTSVVYTYVPIGSYVPNIPGQPSTPIPYPNHPTDPGKPGTDLPSIPHVPGYIPVGPGGVPLQPVDPSDPTKGYIAPPIPENPGQDTPINYIPSPPARPSRPIVVTPVKPETPVEPEVPTTPAQPSPAGPAQPASPGTAQLPNTGTSDSHAVTVIGASLFLAALAIAGTARRREE
ncbi:TPA: MucBP domain-containing protein, partial [Streptococcus suis]